VVSCKLLVSVLDIQSLILFSALSRAKELIMNIVQQRSRTEGTGSSMGDMNMGGGPVNHAHVSTTLGCYAFLRKKVLFS
jgi:hypothetical protein